MTEKKLIRELEVLIKKEIARQKIKRPFGLLLSGGVDSGLLAALTKPDIVFTCKFPYGERYDEFKYAKKICKHLGLKQIVVEPTKRDFFKYLPKATLALGETTTHYSLVPLYMIMEKATEHFVLNLLSGEGPDEYLGGYASYSFITHEQELYKKEELKHYKPLLDKYLGEPVERFAKTVGLPVEGILPHWGKYKHMLSNIGYADLKVRRIEKMELKLAESLGVNLLYPYMTPKVEKFCFTRVPDEMKIRDMTTKYIFKKVAEKYLPKDVVWRKNKMGGPVAPVGKWLGQKDEFKKTNYVGLQKQILYGRK